MTTEALATISAAIEDSFASPNGAGGTYDKRMGYELALGRLTPGSAIAFYESSDVAQLIVDKPVREALREGWCLRLKDEARAKSYTARLRELHAEEHVADAVRKKRALGGAGILLLSNDADLSKPWGKSSKLVGLAVFSPQELWAGTEYIASLDSPSFGLPASYVLQPYGLVMQSIRNIHHSRVIRVVPRNIVRSDILRRLGWGQPLLEPIAREIRDFEIAYSEALGLIPDWGQGSLTLQGLNRALTTADPTEAAAIAARFKLIDQSRSLHRPLPLDAGDGQGTPAEKYERHPTPATGLPELLDRAATRLSVATQFPIAVLTGEQPGGLGQAGDAATRGWYDVIRTVQHDDIAPAFEAIARADGMLWGDETDNAGESLIDFEPLWSPSEQEEAQTELAQAQADDKWFGMGVMSADEIRARRFPKLPAAAPPPPETAPRQSDVAAPPTQVVSAKPTAVTDSRVDELPQSFETTIRLLAGLLRGTP